MESPLKWMDAPGGFLAIFFTRDTTFVTSCLLSCTSNSFWKGAKSEMKEFAPIGTKFLHFWIDLFSEGRQNTFNKITSPESVLIPLNAKHVG